ncbi:hypothetical protein N066_02110 [Mycobacterium tuberculosis variant africanum MAL010111]|uniref:Uncharacterized protein n=1 Tax=Mycobacterium tuberculosis variant africanum K85 TaxID=611304 RepID=A0A9P2M4X8_MYCTX|nr:predicted protein [Mycobacterium tuberculosis variant africanum K85]KBG88734.1 hypothetical protein N066_02110 [Mycobacterium tuberculosis variant africanum MAL010111]KBG96088.1 hypothetical protein N067_02888 [Mycobacterium tuberculosis variant africanum MAL010112]KBH76797.1 hypothetical protein N092_00725 [Mycobacterium tuberculosis variant africanum MAL020136]
MTAVPHLTQSSDPKPREGTETFAKSPRPHRRSACRQTQNPERGRKRGWWASWRWGLSQVVRPKTPRGDGNLHPESPYARNASNVSSDPKPREGTETRNPAPHPQLRHAPEVVRPKTPRGDGNARNRPTWACPQRVVRPKTPRGDGNSITLFLSVARLRVSSDPKPREGTETRKRSTSLTILFSRRQTQNPERGRKHFERELVHSPPFRSSDPKPREGTETPRGWRMRCARKCRQTQNPERGRKPDDEQRHTEPRIRQVVRPKTPRGDGNLHPLVADTADFRESSDPKPREGTETGNCVTARLAGRLSSDPKPREGTETPSDAGTEVDDKPSSDPKPREGTETSTPSVPHTGPVPCRQTQNPERGRKPDGTELSGFYQVVVRPKTPRGDGNPHGGTWTSATIGVVRPKTPRGDGNWTQNRTGCGRCSSRQTQNPERGRKRISPATPQPRYCSMSSDPKPREGTETHRR